jgi:hypothetical protein
VAVGTATLPALVVLLSPNGLALGIGETAIATTCGAAGWLAAVMVTDHPIKREIVAVWRMLVAVYRQVGDYARAAAK